VRVVARPALVDAVVIGGGPAGSSAGRLLASWGHSVVVLDNPTPRARGLAESIPPSTRKLLVEVGALDAIESAHFFRSTGNTVWWETDGARVETFGASSLGYQVFRPELDRLLVEHAASAGVDVRTPARVSAVTFGENGARVDYEHRGRKANVAATMVLDCSGRAGVVGRRFRVPQPGHRTYAIVGVWERERWDVPDETHTLVETYDDGWAWSVPVSSTTRHVGVMVDRGGHYHAEIAKTTHMRRVLDGATLQHEWACDASLYFATTYADTQFLLVGDAGSFIDPLSSFGVKKALASAWMSAVVAHTAMAHPEREAAAFELFSSREREVYGAHLRRSRDFARLASAAHPGEFWAQRASVELDDAEKGSGLFFAGMEKTPDPFSAGFDLALSEEVRFEPRPVIRGNEVVVERAFAGGLRFVNHVDVVALAEIACTHRRLPDLFDAYCRSCPPAPLPNVAGALSVLVAKGILHERT
jgi:flavin-dependent dehydrogenase